MSEASRELLADAEPKAIKAYIDGLQATKSAAHEGLIIASDEPDHAVRKSCADALLNRRLGNPAQAITGEDGGAFKVEGVDLTTLGDVQFAALVAFREALKSGG